MVVTSRCWAATSVPAPAEGPADQKRKCLIIDGLIEVILRLIPPVALPAQTWTVIWCHCAQQQQTLSWATTGATGRMTAAAQLGSKRYPCSLSSLLLYSIKHEFMGLISKSSSMQHDVQLVNYAPFKWNRTLRVYFGTGLLWATDCYSCAVQSGCGSSTLYCIFSSIFLGHFFMQKAKIVTLKMWNTRLQNRG